MRGWRRREGEPGTVDVDLQSVRIFHGSVWFVRAIGNRQNLWHGQTIRFHEIFERSVNPLDPLHAVSDVTRGIPRPPVSQFFSSPSLFHPPDEITYCRFHFSWNAREPVPGSLWLVRAIDLH